eukprot:TRINITY_DN13607_c0_g3_i2.p2 TRINITY_DN13607_c0_g3~~TRINITY_DN13607_c0_g3_i2.p2  ORF type:complete len:122 (-),score=37.59 TRINITY_DN13607_c0_g3_i2:21-386(-)
MNNCDKLISENNSKDCSLGNAKKIISKEYKKFANRLAGNINLLNKDERLSDSYARYSSGNSLKSCTVGLVGDLNLQYTKDQQMLAREEKRMVKSYFKNLLIGREAEERIKLLSTRSKTLKR